MENENTTIDDFLNNCMTGDITIYPKEHISNREDYSTGDVGFYIQPEYESYRLCLYKNIVYETPGINSGSYLYCDIILDMRVPEDREILISGKKIKLWIKYILGYEMSLLKMIKPPTAKSHRRRIVRYSIIDIDDWLKNPKKKTKNISRKPT